MLFYFVSDGFQHCLQADNSHSHMKWMGIQGMHTFKPNERETKEPLHTNLLKNLRESSNTYLLNLQKVSADNDQLWSKAILHYGYHGVNPLLSVDTISLLELQQEETLYNKRFTYVLQRQYFLKYFQYFRETNELKPDQLRYKHQQNFHNKLRDERVSLSIDTDAHSTPINFLLTLSGRQENFIRFLLNFKKEFLEKDEIVNLIVAFFPKNNDCRYSQNNTDNYLIVRYDFERRPQIHRDMNFKTSKEVRFLQEKLNELQSDYPERKIKLILIEGRDFSRGIGLQEASKYVDSMDEIIFFCDVDLVFTTEILSHIRRNTVQGQRVYYPIFFSQFDPAVVYVQNPPPSSYFSFKELDGFWRYFSYGMLSIFKSDFSKTIGFNMEIRGWGLEDLEMVTYYFL